MSDKEVIRFNADNNPGKASLNTITHIGIRQGDTTRFVGQLFFDGDTRSSNRDDEVLSLDEARQKYDLQPF